LQKEIRRPDKSVGIASDSKGKGVADGIKGYMFVIGLGVGGKKTVRISHNTTFFPSRFVLPSSICRVASFSVILLTNTRPARIQQILEHGILYILSLDGTGTEHGKTGLHEKDQGSG
jgi:hypothetical protein